MDNKREKLLGYYIDLITFNNTIDYLLNNIKEKKGTHVITINPEIIEQAQTNTRLDRIIKNAELIVADGTGIKIALKLKGINQERIPGVDLAEKLIEKCSNNNYSVALVGAKEEVIQKTKTNLETKYPELKIPYYRNGYFTENEEEEIIKNISDANPDVILVALGAPKQEFFIEKCREKNPDAIYIGLGGSFDVWAGTVERAPEIYRKIGCEWLYRTFKQPERIKRIYKTLPLFLFKAIIEATKK